VRHRVYGKHLSRSKNERTGLFRNLVQSLVISEKIQTTESKAKAIKGLVDKLINQAKSPNTRRLVSQFLVHKPAHDKLINDLLPRLQSRNSGYTTTVRLGRRLGDGAMVVQMSLLVEESAKKESKVTKASNVTKVQTEEMESEIKDQKLKIKDTKQNEKSETKKGVSS
jgi:large subunit ribosomal protein L17